MSTLSDTPTPTPRTTSPRPAACYCLLPTPIRSSWRSVGSSRVRSGRHRAPPVPPSSAVDSLVRLLDAAVRLERPGHYDRGRLAEPRAQHRAACEDAVGSNRARPAAAPASACRRPYRHAEGTRTRCRAPYRRRGRARTHHHPVGSRRAARRADRERIPVAQASAEADGEAELLASFGTSRDQLLGSGGESEVFAIDEQRVLRIYRRAHDPSDKTVEQIRQLLATWEDANIGLEVPKVIQLGQPWALLHRGPTLLWSLPVTVARAAQIGERRSPQQLPRRHSPAAPAPEPDPGVRETGRTASTSTVQLTRAAAASHAGRTRTRQPRPTRA